MREENLGKKNSQNTENKKSNSDRRETKVLFIIHMLIAIIIFKETVELS